MNRFSVGQIWERIIVNVVRNSMKFLICLEHLSFDKLIFDYMLASPSLVEGANFWYYAGCHVLVWVLARRLCCFVIDYVALLHNDESFTHFGDNLLLGWDHLQKPWMRGNFSQARSFIWLKGKHLRHEVLKTLTKEALWLSLFVNGPEITEVSLADVFVNWVKFSSLVKWICSSFHLKQNNRKSEKIDSLRTKLDFFMLLRSHIV